MRPVTSIAAIVIERIISSGDVDSAFKIYTPLYLKTHAKAALYSQALFELLACDLSEQDVDSFVQATDSLIVDGLLPRDYSYKLDLIALLHRLK